MTSNIYGTFSDIQWRERRTERKTEKFRHTTFKSTSKTAGPLSRYCFQLLQPPQIFILKYNFHDLENREKCIKRHKVQDREQDGSKLLFTT